VDVPEQREEEQHGEIGEYGISPGSGPGSPAWDVARPETIERRVAENNERSGDGDTHTPEEVRGKIGIDLPNAKYDPISPGFDNVEFDGRDSSDSHILKSAGALAFVGVSFSGLTLGAWANAISALNKHKLPNYPPGAVQVKLAKYQMRDDEVLAPWMWREEILLTHFCIYRNEAVLAVRLEQNNQNQDQQQTSNVQSNRPSPQHTQHDQVEKDREREKRKRKAAMMTWIYRKGKT
jgi:hypothetical protein